MHDLLSPFPAQILRRSCPSFPYLGCLRLWYTLVLSPGQSFEREYRGDQSSPEPVSRAWAVAVHTG